MDYYSILGVSKNATFEQIRSAYMEQIKFFHPDVYIGAPEVAQLKTLQLNEAYAILRDIIKRREYDFQLEYECRQSNSTAQPHQESDASANTSSPFSEQDESQPGNFDHSAPPPPADSSPHRVKDEKPNHLLSLKTVPFWNLVLLCSLCCIFLVVSIILGYKLYDSTLETEKKEAEITQLKIYLEDEMATLQTRERRVSELRELADSLIKRNADLNSDLSFWNNSAVIVTTTGKSYHRYNCFHIKDAPFYIFNVGTARSQGYEPCLDCNPPVPDQIRTRYSNP